MPDLIAPVVKMDEEKQIVYGPVLIPDEPDSDGDVVKSEQIEQVSHKFVMDYGNIDLQHSLNNVGKMVESYIAPVDLDFGEGVVVPKGSWLLGVHVTDDDTWRSVKSNELTGFSIMGISKAEKAKESEKDIASKRTTLEDLGDDFIVNAVSLVDEPAVPKAKWVAIKSTATAEEDAGEEYASNENEDIWDKLKGLFGGGKQTAKAGRTISQKNFEDLQTAKEVIDRILDIASKERTEKQSKKEGDDVEEEEVRGIVQEEIEPLKEQINELVETINGGSDDDEEKAAKEKDQSTKSEEEETGEDETEKDTEQEETYKAMLDSLKNKSSVSSRIVGQDNEPAEKEKEEPKPTRDAFGRKIKK